MSEPNSEQQRYAPPMAPDKSYVEINAYVIGWGLFFAALFALAVGYLCLKIGQTVDAFAPVSVLAMGMAVLFKRKNAFPETVHIGHRQRRDQHHRRRHVHPAGPLHPAARQSAILCRNGHPHHPRRCPRRPLGYDLPPLLLRRNGCGISLPVGSGSG